MKSSPSPCKDRPTWRVADGAEPSVGALTVVQPPVTPVVCRLTNYDAGLMIFARGVYWGQNMTRDLQSDTT